jgi:hypothetical protein
MLAGLGVTYYTDYIHNYYIEGHSNGMPWRRLLSGNWHGDRVIWYRGKREVKLYGSSNDKEGNLGILPIGVGMRYPLFVIADKGLDYTPSAPQVKVWDISDPVNYPHGYWGLNDWSGQTQMKLSDATSFFEPNSTTFFPLPQPTSEDTYHGFRLQYFYGGRMRGMLSNSWELQARTAERKMGAVTTAGNSTGMAWGHQWGIYLPIEAQIAVSAAGSLEYPGLPQGAIRSTGVASFAYLCLPQPSGLFATNQWHRIVVKVGPDVAVVARGVQLRVNSGASGTAAAQAGIEFKRKTTTGFESFTPGEILEGSDLYTELTGPNGLVLFIKLSPEVDQVHHLSLDLLPNSNTLAPLEYQQLPIIPVEVAVVKEGEPAAPEDGLVVKKSDTVRYRLSPGLPDTPLMFEDKVQWHWRILKWDGTYGNWTAYTNGKGHTFTAQPQDAGIYEVKASVEGQDYFLKRAKDDPHSAKKKDENECFGVVDEQWQINVRNQAKVNLGSVAYAKLASNGNFEAGDNKCNLFVAHKATDAGAIVPKINGTPVLGGVLLTSYPSANQ